MPAPIRNILAHPVTLIQSGIKKPVIRIDFERAIFSNYVEDFFFLYKYEIPESSFDVVTYMAAGGGILHYLSDDLIAGHGLYVGGFDTGEYKPNKMDITSNIQQGAAFLLDKDVREGYTYIYEFLYRYNDYHYSLTDVSSLLEIPFVNIELPDTKHPICMRRRNHVYRGPFASIKHNNNRQEIKEDISLLESDITTLTSAIQNVTLYDDYFAKVYALEESIYFLGSLQQFGYGIGVYGKKGGYGF